MRQSSQPSLVRLFLYVLFVQSAICVLPALNAYAANSRAGEPFVLAQEVAPSGQAAPTPAPVQPSKPAAQPAKPAAAPVLDKEQLLASGEITKKFGLDLDIRKKALDGLAKEARNFTTKDIRLKELPSLLEQEVVKLRAYIDGLQPLLKERQDRLAKLGEPPKAGATAEAPELVKERKLISAQAAAYDSLIKSAELQIVRAGQITANANAKRRERFSNQLLAPVDNFYSASFWREAFANIPSQGATAIRALSAAMGSIAKAKPWQGILVVILPLVVALGMWRLLLVAHQSFRLQQFSSGDRPRRAELGARAALRIVRQTLPVVAGLMAAYMLSARFDLFSPPGDEFLFNCASALGFAWALFVAIQEVFTPSDPRENFVRIDTEASSKVGFFLSVMVLIWLADSLLGQLDQYLVSPFGLTLVRSLLAALSYALPLFLLLLLHLRKEPSAKRSRYNGWPTILFVLLALIVAAIFISVMLGYVSLGRFVGAQVVATGGIGLLMYLSHLAAEHLSSVSVIESGGDVAADPADAPSVVSPASTLRVMVGLFIDILILLVGIPAILLQWGYDWAEVRGWLSAAFFGFQVGDFRVSVQNVMIAIAILAGGIMFTRGVQRWFMKRSDYGRRGDSGVRDSVRAGLGYVGFILSALAATSYLGINFSNLAIIAGALSVGIGFGLQSIVNNFVSGLILLVERPVKVGDWISVGEADGLVRKISVRATELETLDKQSIIVPNSEFISKPVTNWMYKERIGRINVSVGVSYASDVDEVERVLLEAAKGNKFVIASPRPSVVFNNFGDSSLDFLLRVYISDMEHKVPAASSIRFAVWRALKAAGIEIPFPQRDIHIKDIQEVVHSAREAKREPVV